jgi:hypothetical protein
MWKIFLLVIFPFTIASSGYYFPITDDLLRNPPKSIYFYNLPIVKLISSTLSCINVFIVIIHSFILFLISVYLGFLALLTANILLIDPSETGVDLYGIEWYEWLLWFWILASLVEEAVQFWEDRGNPVFFSFY